MFFLIIPNKLKFYINEVKQLKLSTVENSTNHTLFQTTGVLLHMPSEEKGGSKTEQNFDVSYSSTTSLLSDLFAPNNFFTERVFENHLKDFKTPQNIFKSLLTCVCISRFKSGKLPPPAAAT